MRTFIALPISEDSREKILSSTYQVKGIKRAHFIKPENLHITLRFLGEMKENDINPLTEKLEPIAKEVKPFKIDYHNIQLFPKKKPHCLALIVHLNEALATLYKLIDDACNTLNLIPDNRPFLPHVTLARLKTPDNFKDFQTIDMPFSENINEFNLYESLLSPDGSFYKSTKKFKLLRQ